MAQRQFRSDDTSKWLERFGNGSDGDVTISSSMTTGVGNLGIYYGKLSGTIGNTTATITAGFDWSGKPVLIHQGRGTNAGKWELNVQTGIVDTTATFKYPLTNTYSNAQIITMNQYRNLTIASGVQVAAEYWSDLNLGGGIIPVMVSEVLSGPGAFYLHSRGYIGGPSAGTSFLYGYSGEGHPGNYFYGMGVNGNGGSGGSNGASQDGAGGGGGGGNRTAGTKGGNGNTGRPGGDGGTVFGDAELITNPFGGGGGSGGTFQDGSSAFGGRGGGIILIFAKKIQGNLQINVGGQGGQVKTGGNAWGGGGGGAGGSVLIKTQIADLGTNLIIGTGGAGSSGGPNGGAGGAGGSGRIHIDYGISYTGTSNPTIDARLDTSLKEAAAPLFFAQP